VIGNMELTVTDIRKSILENLQERFNKAGVKTYQSMLADLSRPVKGIKPKYDLIIADVPCSGSGTWGRTPEEMHFFSAEKLAEYSALQKQIIANTLPALLPGGQFLYITCSVYADENEAAVNYMVQQLSFRLNRMENIRGFRHCADTMFAAWLSSPE
jgi:16S rRNA (cytosine967-C5)-methyltransferase